MATNDKKTNKKDPKGLEKDKKASEINQTKIDNNGIKLKKKRGLLCDFLTEKEVESYIFNNAESFCKDILSDRLISINRQMLIKTSRSKKDRGKCIDLYFECEKYFYIVEVKKPNAYTDNLKAIGQLLNYGRLKTDSEKETKLILITTLFDEDSFETINFYGLPIGYMCIEKDRLVVMS